MLKKTCISLSFCFFSILLSAQIEFEPGYIINNSGQRISCYIKNLEWKNNPSQFQYKTLENSDEKTGTVTEIQEFGVTNGPVFISKTILIDRSPWKTSELTMNRSFSWKEETLFLKKIVNGEANLYYYEDGDLRRFFFNVGNDEIVQLRHKIYKREDLKIGENNEFRQQLWNALDCGGFSKNGLQKLQYKINPLTKVFNDFNECADPSFLKKVEGNSKIKVVLTPNIGMNFASLSIDNGPFALRTTNFDSKSSIRAGIEFEMFLPFNNKKWSVFITPTFQSFNKEGLSNDSFLFSNPIEVSIDYSSLEFPLGFRHYFYLNKNAIFVDASLVFDFDFDSKIEFENNTELEVDAWGNARFGLGYKINQKFNIQAIYFTPRNLLNKYQTWYSDYNVYSLLVGYSF